MAESADISAQENVHLAQLMAQFAFHLLSNNPYADSATGGLTKEQVDRNRREQTHPYQATGHEAQDFLRDEARAAQPAPGQDPYEGDWAERSVFQDQRLSEAQQQEWGHRMARNGFSDPGGPYVGADGTYESGGVIQPYTIPPASSAPGAPAPRLDGIYGEVRDERNTALQGKGGAALME